MTLNLKTARSLGLEVPTMELGPKQLEVLRELVPT
jgi:hypothetical protein